MKILIADDHAVLRKGLIQILAEEHPNAQFGEASTTSETLVELVRYALEHGLVEMERRLRAEG